MSHLIILDCEKNVYFYSMIKVYSFNQEANTVNFSKNKQQINIF